MNFPAIELALGVMATQDMVQPDEKFVIASDNFQRVMTYVQDVTVNFGYQSSYVNGPEYRDEDWKALKDLIALAGSADSVSIVGVATESYASPEGEITLNEDLAMDRAKSANKAVAKALGRKGIELEESAVRAMPKGEDWDGFKKAMRASSIADKDLIFVCSRCTATRTSAKKKSRTSPRRTRKSKKASFPICVALKWP